MLKSIYLKSIKYYEQFDYVNGSYYDRVAEFYSTSKMRHKAMCEELNERGWEHIPTNNGITVYLKDRHVIRIFPMWEVVI